MRTPASTPQPLPMPREAAPGQRWAVLLAGGRGERLRPVVEAWLGEARPKQFCTFTGTRSMLQHALDRALHWVAPQRIVTVIGPGQREWLEEAVDAAPPGCVLEQPRDRGTAAALLAALGYILEHDPQATVLVLPADQFAHPEERMVRHLGLALRAAEAPNHPVVLLGAAPSAPETDLGWIVPGTLGTRQVPGALLNVAGFVEKPDPATARHLLHTGALWNTLTFAARGHALWGFLADRLPAWARPFAEYRLLLQAGALRPNREFPWIDMHYAALRRTYAKLPAAADFSTDVLTRLAGLPVLVQPLADLEWSDWGRPDRLREGLERLRLPHCDILRHVLRHATAAPHPAWEPSPSH